MTYKAITRHPLTGIYENATWHDDYFGPHEYGVEFSDGKVWTSERVERYDIKNFWVKDVELAFTDWAKESGFFKENIPDEVCKFMNEIQHQYKLRWSRDPSSGEGASFEGIE